MFTDTHDAILLVLSAAFAIWQIWALVVTVAMVKTGKYTNITVPPGPGVLAVVLLIVAVLW